MSAKGIIDKIKNDIDLINDSQIIEYEYTGNLTLCILDALYSYFTKIGYHFSFEKKEIVMDYMKYDERIINYKIILRKI